jgi:hypothetical protein
VDVVDVREDVAGHDGGGGPVGGAEGAAGGRREELRHRGHAVGDGERRDVPGGFHAQHPHPVLLEGLEDGAVVAGHLHHEIPPAPAVRPHGGLGERLGMATDGLRGGRDVDVVPVEDVGGNDVVELDEPAGGTAAHGERVHRLPREGGWRREEGVGERHPPEVEERRGQRGVARPAAPARAGGISHGAGASRREWPR